MGDEDVMEDATAKHVQKLASGGYRYRRKVPLDLRETIGKREIVVSLRTSRHEVAALAAGTIDEAVELEFERLRKGLEASSFGGIAEEAKVVAKEALGRLGFGNNG